MRFTKSREFRAIDKIWVDVFRRDKDLERDINRNPDKLSDADLRRESKGILRDYDEVLSALKRLPAEIDKRQKAQEKTAEKEIANMRRKVQSSIDEFEAEVDELADALR